MKICFQNSLALKKCLKTSAIRVIGSYSTYNHITCLKLFLLNLQEGEFLVLPSNATVDAIQVLVEGVLGSQAPATPGGASCLLNSSPQHSQQEVGRPPTTNAAMQQSTLKLHSSSQGVTMLNFLSFFFFLGGGRGRGREGVVGFRSLERLKLPLLTTKLL